MGNVTITINGLELDLDIALRIAKVLKKHEPDIWYAIREELNNLRQLENGKPTMTNEMMHMYAEEFEPLRGMMK